MVEESKQDNTIVDENEKYSLIKNTKKGTQKRTIAEIFDNRKGIWIPKREIEKIFGLKTALKDVDLSTINNMDDLLKQAKKLPGDVQRQIRTFYYKFCKYGLKREGNGKKLKYKWEPVNKYEDFVKDCPRDLFKTKRDRYKFCESKKFKCEVCGNGGDGERMAIDHWRAHSIYKIDDKKIAVHLCEKCNNIHHNHDAVKIAKKNYDNQKIIKKWINIELRIRKNGYLPNDNDKKQQLSCIKYIIDKNNDDGINFKDDFWKGLNM